MTRHRARDEAVLDFVRRHWRSYGYGPTLREIMAGTGVSSTSVAHAVVRRLVAKGRLRQLQGRPAKSVDHRRIVPVDLDECPFCKRRMA